MAWQDQEREVRLEASRRFWNEISKTRKIDPLTGEPESLRRWGKRIGVDINNLVQWQRGGSITPKMIRRVVDALDLPQSEFFRLFAISEPESPPFSPVNTIDLYSALKTKCERGYIEGDKIGVVPVSPDMMRDANVSSKVIAIKLPDDCDDSSPTIPPGSIVYIDMTIGTTEDTFIDGIVYAINDEGQDRIILRMLHEIKGVLWCDYLNRSYKGERCWTADLRKLVVGKVFMTQSPVRRVA